MPLDQGLEPGRKAPGFELPEVEGDTVALEDLLGGPVILIFYRGSW
ncbi:MAG: redoxin domain-containing protein [Longimicrobiales bacterium]|nr:redoxin domain-containing protein [Longimicrobiales bacterium]